VANVAAEDAPARRWRIWGVIALVVGLFLPVLCAAAFAIPGPNIVFGIESAVVNPDQSFGVGLLPMAVVFCVISARSPATARNKWISVAWAIADLLIVAAAVLVPAVVFMPDGVAAALGFCAPILMGVLFLGWWLALRGRTGFAYLSLVAAAIVVGIISAVQTNITTSIVLNDHGGAEYSMPANTLSPADVAAGMVSWAAAIATVAVLACGAWLAAGIDRTAARRQTAPVSLPNVLESPTAG